MRTIYTIRNRYALAAIVSLLITMLLGAPLEAMFVSHALLHSSSAQVIQLTLRLALFVWLFWPAQVLWGRWLTRRPTLLDMGGIGTPASQRADPYAAREKPERPGA